MYLNKLAFLSILTFLMISGVISFSFLSAGRITGAPPYGEPKEAAPFQIPLPTPWKRPDGPAKVGLQVGHWKNSELPEELSRLIGNTGASGGGKSEAEVNLAIAQEMKPLLEEKGIVVDIIPATVPPKYWADVFLAIHADGSEDSTKSGYKFGSPWRDYTGHSNELVSILEKYYEEATGLENDPNVTRNMRGYYAFAWWRYEHSIDPMTTAAIAETGFMTNPSDRRMLIDNPELPATAMSNAIIEFLQRRELI